MTDPTGKAANVPLDTSCLYRACPQLLTRADGEEVLAYDPREMKVHALNASLALVFRMCDGQTPCEAMVVAFVERFGLDIATASRETYRALKLLASTDLIEAA